MSLLLSLLLVVGAVLGLEHPSFSTLPASIITDYDLHSGASTGSNGLITNHYEGTYVSTGRPYSAYAAVFNPDFFSFYPPTKSGCTNRVKVSTSSVNFDCAYGTNGGFFNTSALATPDNLCEGNLISDVFTQIAVDTSGTKRAEFGILSNNTIIVGFLDSNTIANNQFKTLLTGWGWLVRNGVNNINSSQDFSSSSTSFIDEKAPRTTVGLFKNGSMILLQIDGEEDILAGPDLNEAAELLISLGVESAINIDGGGSSVSVYNGDVVDYPTCNDTSEKCERNVASFACVKK
jgi:N-acetylglucosamine-1-phosphodiester alpha-N-acetylglucosaminidase